MTDLCKSILNFFHITEQLKNELRHSWTSQARQESVAEHSWRLSLMLIICFPYLDKKINLLKALKMAVLHDLGEIKIGDQHHLDIIKNKNTQKTRSNLEKKAIKDLTIILKKEGKRIEDLWLEFEKKQTLEAKIVYFLDKLEVCIQHNEGDASFWTKNEIDSIEEYFDQLKTEDSFLLSLKEIIKAETLNKIKAR